MSEFHLDSDVDSAKLWESSVPGVELFKAQFFNHAFAKHIHETYTIGLNDGGQGRFIYRGEVRCAYPNSFNLLNPGEAHTGQAASDTGWRYRNLYIGAPLVKQLLPQLGWQSQSLPYFLQPVVSAQSLQASFCNLFKSLGEPASQLEQQSLILNFFSQILRKYAKPHHHLRTIKPETKAIACVRDYLEAHYADNVTINTLAELTGLNPHYLIRCFHQQIGLPPHRFQKHVQLLKAKRDLKASKPVSEVAIEHGFYDQSHLTRHFKRVFGVTPGQYRQVNSVQDT